MNIATVGLSPWTQLILISSPKITEYLILISSPRTGSIHFSRYPAVSLCHLCEQNKAT